MRTNLMKQVLGLTVLVSLTLLPRTTEGQTTLAGWVATGIDCAWTVTSPTHTACTGAWDGNDNPPASVLPLIQADISDGGLGLESWSIANWVGKGEVGGPSGPFQGPLPDSNDNTLYLNHSYTGTFVLFLKSSTAFSGFRIEADGMTSIDFTMAGVSQNGDVTDATADRTGQNLSHASVWFDGTTTVVPEPSTVILLGSGILGLGLVGYRRRKLS